MRWASAIKDLLFKSNEEFGRSRPRWYGYRPEEYSCFEPLNCGRCSFGQGDAMACEALDGDATIER